VRCFGSPAQTLDLSDGNGRPAQWTIILGDNGVGKTTLLRSIAAMNPLEQTFTFAEYDAKNNHPYDKRVAANIPAYAVRDERNLKWNVLRNDSQLREANINAKYLYGMKLSEINDNAIVRTYSVNTDGETVTVSFPDRPPDSYDAVIDANCFGYGASRRMDESSLAVRNGHGVIDSLFRDDVTLLNAEEWLLRADYAASKSSQSQKQATVRRDQIREVLLKVLPKDEVRGIRFIDKGWEFGVNFKTPYGWVRLYDLSLGYRTLIAWMVDFASRMFDRYPDSANPLAEPAVCLVDEIDLHLHPTWQRKLVGYLTELFPNTQFIVTAHSPLIVQAATNANIVVLRREGDHVVIDNSVESLAGWSVDQILTSDLYGLVSNRAPKYDEAIIERQRLLSKPELTASDKRRLRTLEAEVDELPVGGTAEESKAFDLVRRFAADLENKGITRESLAQVATPDEAKEQGTKRAPRAKKSSKKSASVKKSSAKRRRGA
jgi:predicted ATPase